jgi:hypothetical protein
MHATLSQNWSKNLSFNYIFTCKLEHSKPIFENVFKNVSASHKNANRRKGWVRKKQKRWVPQIPKSLNCHIFEVHLSNYFGKSEQFCGFASCGTSLRSSYLEFIAECCLSEVTASVLGPSSQSYQAWASMNLRGPFKKIIFLKPLVWKSSLFAAL